MRIMVLESSPIRKFRDLIGLYKTKSLSNAEKMKLNPVYQSSNYTVPFRIRARMITNNVLS